MSVKVPPMSTPTRKRFAVMSLLSPEHLAHDVGEDYHQNDPAT
jgi:hypothetical protein